MAKIDELKQTFFDECDEALQQIEEGLTAIRNGQDNEETIHAVFRGVHSVKGGAGIFGFEALVRFAHAFETVLDLLRHHKIERAETTIDSLLSANDVLFDLIRLSRSGERIEENFGADCRNSLDAISGENGAAAENLAPADFEDIDFMPVMAGVEEVPFERSVEIEIWPGPGATLSKIANLRHVALTAGDISLDLVVSDLTSSADHSKSSVALSWILKLKTTLASEEVRELLAEFSPSIEIKVTDPFDAVEQLEHENEASVSAATADEPGIPDLATAVESSGPVSVSADGAERKPAANTTTTRIELEKIDRAVNLVSELVIAQAMLGQIVSELPENTSSSLLQSVQEVLHHTRELKDSVMSMRAQPVGSVFQRMPRLVRELSAKTGKKVRLELYGEKTEVDRSIIERLSDPLTHIIRNSVDHGIEHPKDRIARGKKEEGTIRLSAEHRGGKIVIEIRDDGAGINSERVLKKAQERGLVKVNAQLAEDEINSLIMLPGFSTAESISDISGRGVGMDVVRASITDIGGRVSLKSERGRGMTIQLSLPLTLAVMDGMVIKAANEIYVVPLSAIVECMLPERKLVANLIGTHGMLQLRGEHVPMLRLAECFGLGGQTASESDQVVVVTDTGDGKRIGLVVDELCGHQQVVIKSIEESYGTVPGIAAATILGNGRVAFILDVEKLPEIAADTLAKTFPKVA